MAQGLLLVAFICVSQVGCGGARKPTPPRQSVPDASSNGGEVLPPRDGPGARPAGFSQEQEALIGQLVEDARAFSAAVVDGAADCAALAGRLTTFIDEHESAMKKRSLRLDEISKDNLKEVGAELFFRMSPSSRLLSHG